MIMPFANILTCPFSESEILFLQAKKQVSKSCDYRVKSITKKKIVRLLDKETPLLSVIFHILFLDVIAIKKSVFAFFLEEGQKRQLPENPDNHDNPDKKNLCRFSNMEHVTFIKISAYDYIIFLPNQIFLSA